MGPCFTHTLLGGRARIFYPLYLLYRNMTSIYEIDVKCSNGFYQPRGLLGDTAESQGGDPYKPAWPPWYKCKANTCFKFYFLVATNTRPVLLSHLLQTKFYLFYYFDLKLNTKNICVSEKKSVTIKFFYFLHFGRAITSFACTHSLGKPAPTLCTCIYWVWGCKKKVPRVRRRTSLPPGVNKKHSQKAVSLELKWESFPVRKS